MIKFSIKGLAAEWRKRGARVPIFDNLDFEFDSSRDGRMLALLGPSGHGKSTFMYLLSGMKYPKKGNINWSIDVESIDLTPEIGKTEPNKLAEYRKKHFGFVFQNSTLNENFTLEQNLLYPYYLRGKSTKNVKEEIRNKMEEVSLSGLHDKLSFTYPHQISLGQKQRMAVLQTLLQNPNVIFADEPTGSLDHDTREKVMKLLANWTREDNNRLMVWVTHHQSDPTDRELKKFLRIARPDDEGEGENQAAKVEWKSVEFIKAPSGT